jgi:hypothetical protein
VDREVELKARLCRIAPVVAEVCDAAQRHADLLKGTEWAADRVARVALLNRLIGTARWGFAGDGLLQRREDLTGHGVFQSTNDAQHNQGRYYWNIPDLGVVLTIRRKAHEDPKDVSVLQLQIEGVLDHAPPAFADGAVVVYLAVPPLGQQPKFEITVNGEVKDEYRVRELFDPAAPSTVTEFTPRRDDRQRRRVRSNLEQDEEASGDQS